MGDSHQSSHVTSLVLWRNSDRSVFEIEYNGALRDVLFWDGALMPITVLIRLDDS